MLNKCVLILTDNINTIKKIYCLKAMVLVSVNGYKPNSGLRYHFAPF